MACCALIALFLLLTACTTTPEQKQALAEFATAKVNSGAWSPEYAQQFLEASAFDWNGIGMMLGVAATSLIGGPLVVRATRGPAKKIPKEQVPVLQEMLKAKTAS